MIRKGTYISVGDSLFYSSTSFSKYENASSSPSSTETVGAGAGLVSTSAGAWVHLPSEFPLCLS